MIPQGFPMWAETSDHRVYLVVGWEEVGLKSPELQPMVVGPIGEGRCPKEPALLPVSDGVTYGVR